MIMKEMGPVAAIHGAQICSALDSASSGNLSKLIVAIKLIVALERFSAGSRDTSGYPIFSRLTVASRERV